MKIFFGQHFGKDVSELDSGYLVWIIESYPGADWLLIDACKKELSSRLKLDWEPPTLQDDALVQLHAEVVRLRGELIEERMNWIRICKIHGIDYRYFLAMGRMFVYSMFMRTVRDNTFRLPEAFKTDAVPKTDFNIYKIEP
jgi:hypothetical protein